MTEGPALYWIFIGILILTNFAYGILAYAMSRQLDSIFRSFSRVLEQLDKKRTGPPTGESRKGQT